jgi:sec-independent protein translocase protein TatB
METFVSAAHVQLSLAFMAVHPPILLGTVSMVDSIILMVMALVVFGPRRLPQIGRQIGKLMYEFRKASNDFKFQMEEELRVSEEADRRKKEEERQRSLSALAATEQASVSADPAPVKPIESPYPGEGTYPAQYPTEAPAEPTTQESTPRITPPSVGEVVSRPGPVEQLPVEPATSPVSDVAGGSEANENHSANPAEALNQHG